MKYNQTLTVDLHRHLEGSIRPETIFDLKDNDEELSTLTLKEIKERMVINDKAENLIQFIDKLGTKFMKRVTKRPEQTYRFAYECFEDGAKEGLEILEVRFCVPNFPDSHLEEIYKARKDAEKNLGIKLGLIQALLRNYPDNLNERLTVQAIEDFEKGNIVGVDLAGPESQVPNRNFKKYFDRLHAAGIPITIHAGEDAGPENVESAIIDLHARRIGHGTRSVESEQVVKLLKDRNILIETCITSNYQTNALIDVADHPIFKLLDHGIQVAIATDDPVTSGITLSSEERLARQTFDLSETQLKKINQTAINHSFIPNK